MSFNFEDDADDLWKEFNHSKTTWERRVDILFNLAGLEARDGNFHQETELLENAVELARTHNLREQLYKYLNVLSSRSMYGTQDYELSLKAANEVIDAFPGFNVEIDVMEWVGTAYCNKGRALMELKRYPEAAPALRAALDYAELINDLPETAHTNMGLMRCYIELDELDKAKAFGNAAKAIYQDRSQIMSVCEIDRLFAKINILEGNAIRAKEDLKEIRALEQRYFHASNWETKLLLGVAYLELGQFDRAEHLFDKIFSTNIQPWAKNFDVALEAAYYLIEALRGQGKHDEAARVEIQRTALSKRIPGAKVQEHKRTQEEIRNLRSIGKKDLAQIRSEQWLAEVNEAGDIELHWRAVCETILSLRDNKDYAAIAKLWDGTPRQGLNYQDEVVIRIKNVITHALQKVGRHQEALDLNEEVRYDARTEQDFLQKAYALENAARINKDLQNTRVANKFKEQSLENYIANGMNDRALELIEYFKKK